MLMNSRYSDVEKDINDVFDTIAFPEEQISNEAFQEGLSKGKKDGKIDGYHLGFHRGLELGTEIGFYKGLTKALVENFDSIKLKNDKVLSLVNKLSDSLEKFPKDNNESIDVVKEMDNIRACYRKLNSLLKLNLAFPVTSSMSF